MVEARTCFSLMPRLKNAALAALTPYLLLGAVKVWANILEQRLTTLCFWLFEPRKLKLSDKNIAEWMFVAWYHIAPSVCREGTSYLHTHTFGRIIYQRRERHYSVCFQKGFPRT